MIRRGNNISKFIELIDDRYPEKLKNISNPPNKIYYKGNVELLKEDGIAIIGTRHITEYGVKMSRKFTKEIALRDIVVISGMAIGVDTVAHTETLKMGGKTIAVLGSGFDNIYPKENADLYKKIIDNEGLVITEFEDNVKPESSNFPRRNRIVAALSRTILVIEAGYRSGTSITAELAWKQGKSVYAIPGRLDNAYGVGVNKLIKNGAKLVTNINDILEDFTDWKKKKKRINKYNLNIKREYRKIYNVIGENPMSIDEIAIKTNNDVICVSKLLVLMELEDLVEERFGGYIKKNIEE